MHVLRQYQNKTVFLFNVLEGDRLRLVNLFISPKNGNNVKKSCSNQFYSKDIYYAYFNIKNSLENTKHNLAIFFSFKFITISFFFFFKFPYFSTALINNERIINLLLEKFQICFKK